MTLLNLQTTYFPGLSQRDSPADARQSRRRLASGVRGATLSTTRGATCKGCRWTEISIGQSPSRLVLFFFTVI